MCLDNYKNIRHWLETENGATILWPAEKIEWENLLPEDRLKKLWDLCENPIHDFSVVYRWYFRLKWINIFSHFRSDNNSPNVVEIGSGESDIIPLALAKVTINAKYTSVNMNDILSDNLLKKLDGLPLQVEIVRDNAVNVHKHLPVLTTDIIVFEHSVNDILQAMLAEANGYDTVNLDWFELLPNMIKLINEVYLDERLADSLKEPFMALMQNCFLLLRPGGILVISHYMFQYDLDLGYHPYLWENMLNIIRPWLNELRDGTEITLEGFNSKWWCFYQKSE